MLGDGSAKAFGNTAQLSVVAGVELDRNAEASVFFKTNGLGAQSRKVWWVARGTAFLP
jgi:uncharacterized metal-binding protein